MFQIKIQSTPAHIIAAWRRGHPLFKCLRPLSYLYSHIMQWRRIAYQRQYPFFKTTTFNVPVIVVGNIQVGGTGKSPMVIWLAKFLKSHGYHPGIISRGYKSHIKTYPHLVTPTSDPYLYGDEPVMLAEQTDCPVVIDPSRVRGIKWLLSNITPIMPITPITPITPTPDIIISDDGLQHYALGRTLEIVMHPRFQPMNQDCLPAGPMREPVSRLREPVSRLKAAAVGCESEPEPEPALFIINSGDVLRAGDFVLRYQLGPIRPLIRDDGNDNGNSVIPLDTFKGKTVHAICGIARPERFFGLLRASGIQVIPHSFPDHCVFKQTDIDFGDDYPVLMTEKDAVKYRSFTVVSGQHFVVGLDIEPDPLFVQDLLAVLASRGFNKKRKENQIHE